MEKLQKAVKKFTRVRLQKMHLDYLAGILSIPVLISAIIINWGNLSKIETNTKVTPTPEVIIVNQKTPATPVTPSASCRKIVGPIEITSPEEGDTVTDSPLCITISYPDSDYCSVVWSYRINNGPWSDFNNTSPCFYNVPSGPVQFSLRVNSTVSSSQKTLTRNFTYEGTTITPTPAASSSASANTVSF